MSKTIEEIQSYLKEKKADYSDISQPLDGYLKDWIYDITVEWGDWKHSHHYLRILMGELGYVETKQVVTEENGSDCYSAIHRFALETGVELFK